MMIKLRKIRVLFLSFVMVLSICAGTKLNVSAEEKGSIIITKYQIDDPEVYNNLSERANGNQINDGSLDKYKPLEGVMFRLTRVKQEEGMNAGNAKPDTSFAPEMLTTGADGVVTFDHLERGVYLLEEVSGPEAITISMEPVLISVPMENAAYEQGSGLDEMLWNIYVYPKNLLDKDAPKIEKDVIQYTNNDAGVDRGESFSWIVTTSIPNDIATAQKYAITDKLDTRLDFDETVSPTVVVNGTALKAGTDYIFTYGSDNRNLEFNFTKAGMQRLAEMIGQKVTVTFNTKVNDTAELGVSIPNTAKLQYTNELGEVHDSVSDTPEVHIGGFAIYKVDAKTGKPLGGAVFGIYGNEADAANKENELRKVTSQEDGYAVFDGLKYGGLGQTTGEGKTEYWISELEAPTVNGVSYKLLEKPLHVTITVTSHEKPTALKVENTQEDSFLLPFTGGIGTIIYILGGAALLGAAYVLIKKDCKKDVKKKTNKKTHKKNL